MTKHLSAYIANAVRKGNLNAVKRYLRFHAGNEDWLNASEKEQYGCCFYSPSGQEHDCLAHLAVRHGKTAIIRELVSCDDIILTIVNRSYQTPLTLAIQYNRLECVNLLLKDPRVMDHVANPLTGETGLFLAAKLGRFEVAQALLAHGANIDHKNMMGATAEQEARAFGHTDIADLIHAHQMQTSSLPQDHTSQQNSLSRGY